MINCEFKFGLPNEVGGGKGSICCLSLVHRFFGGVEKEAWYPLHVRALCSHIQKMLPGQWNKVAKYLFALN